MKPRSYEETIRKKTLQREDGSEVILVGHGFEWDLGMFFCGKHYFKSINDSAKEICEDHIRDKRVLVVPAYGPTPFVMKKLGAREVVGIDADPVTIDWQTALQQHFENDSLGADVLATGNYPAGARWGLLSRKGLSHEGLLQNRIAQDVHHVIVGRTKPKPLEGVTFEVGSLGELPEGSQSRNIVEVLADQDPFDFIVVPYLLGINNGIQDEQQVKRAIDVLWELGKDGAVMMVAPFSESEEGIMDFGNEEIIQKLESLFSEDRFEIFRRIDLAGVEVAFIRVKKT